MGTSVVAVRRVGAAWLVVLLGVCPVAAQVTPDPVSPEQSHQHEMTEDSSAPLGIPSSREGSGTAWLPDDTPMYAIHRQHGTWELMVHGNVFGQYLFDSGPRGAGQLGSINWVMGMAQRPISGGRLGFRAMLSAEPGTVRGCGYPDLLATGETCKGRPIVDRQHQHDLFMEIAARYERSINDRIAFQVYGGPAGEPALGPVAYPHRTSAMPNPLAPISHHWMDATHITFGVLTGAVYGRKWKAEASVFNGREPDEARYGWDLGAMNSISARFWLSPTPNLSLQVSSGQLKEAEPAEDARGRVDVTRVTASATYHRLLRSEASIWASTLVWGRNSEQDESSNFVLAETNVTLDDRTTWFGRIDVGGKSAHDLDVHAPGGIFTIAKLQGGYVRYFGAASKPLKIGLGTSVLAGFVPQALKSEYGARMNLGVGMFVTVRPSAMRMSADPHADHRMP